MTEASNKTKIQIALDELERENSKYRNEKSSRSNQYPVGHPNRIEEDLTEIQKAHLGLLETKVYAAIATEFMKVISDSSKINDDLGKKVLCLNKAMIGLTVVIAISAIVEIFQ